jgi:hypothetical protein
MHFFISNSIHNASPHISLMPFISITTICSLSYAHVAHTSLPYSNVGTNMLPYTLLLASLDIYSPFHIFLMIPLTFSPSVTLCFISLAVHTTISVNIQPKYLQQSNSSFLTLFKVISTVIHILPSC